MTIQYLKKATKTASTDDSKTRGIVEKLLSELEKSKEEGCKELTKKFEEVLTLKVSEIIKNLSSRDNIKGEIIIVIEGEVKKDKPQNLDAILGDALKSMSLSDAAKEISKYTNFSKKEVYNAALDLKGRKNES